MPGMWHAGGWHARHGGQAGQADGMPGHDSSKFGKCCVPVSPRHSSPNFKKRNQMIYYSNLILTICISVLVVLKDILILLYLSRLRASS